MTDTRLFHDMQVPFADAREKAAMNKANMLSTRPQRQAALLPTAQDYAVGAGLASNWAQLYSQWENQMKQTKAADMASVKPMSTQEEMPWRTGFQLPFNNYMDDFRRESMGRLFNGLQPIQMPIGFQQLPPYNGGPLPVAY
jgi:hypothetical protein